MPEPMITVFGVTLSSFTWYTGLGVMLMFSAWVGVARVRGVETWRAVDAGLLALGCGLLGGRLGDMALVDSGGLLWHGAWLGALMGGVIGGRVWRVPLARLIPALTVTFPALVVLGAYACGAVACGYGAEVPTLADYPAGVVAELRDIYGLTAPRYHTPLMGMGLGVMLAMVGCAWVWRDRGAESRAWGGLWLIVCLFSCGMFIMGFMQGDYTPEWAGLRADQWLDAGIAVVSCAGFMLTYIRTDVRLNLRG